jgi:DNA topoisomerase-3
MTRRIVDRAKQYEYDTIPGDFGILAEKCPKCGGEVRERYRAFQCTNEKCDFSIRKAVSGRILEYAEVEQLIREKTVGPLQGFRSKMGKPFAAVLKLNAVNALEFDFGQDQRNAEGEAAKVDFSSQEPAGICPKCKNRIYELPMQYICEKAIGQDRTCDFRTGKIILQQAIDRAQIQKLLQQGKTDLLTKFISKKGRPFKAYLTLNEGKVEFAFEPRPARGKAGKAAEPRAPREKIDFTGKAPFGKCPICAAAVFETESAFVCEKSQADKKPCKFKINKTILSQTIGQAEAAKLLAGKKTDLLPDFVSSKTGRSFKAYLIMDELGKVTFEFPPREGEGEGGAPA